ncbi:MAG TPA: TonB family protein, partial [Gammaproteobacteria bacterium]|nr:TonB family protein [Gammaproteobacteria bacterium]
DAHGRLVGLKILKSQGNPALDRAAEGIVRMSAPFAPLPSRLRRKTPGIELTLYMDFYGYLRLYTEY